MLIIKYLLLSLRKGHNSPIRNDKFRDYLLDRSHATWSFYQQVIHRVINMREHTRTREVEGLRRTLLQRFALLFGL